MFANAFVIPPISFRLLETVVRRTDVRMVLLCLVLSSFWLGCGSPESANEPASPSSDVGEASIGNDVEGEEPDGEDVGIRGGRLVITLRAEPKSFNPLVAFDNPSLEILDLLHADLVRLHARRQESELSLAASVESSDDGLRYRMTLRPDLRFSDGELLDANDVVFTYQQLLEPALEAPQRETLTLDGQPIEVRAIDDQTVEFTLPRPHAGGETLFESVLIVPEHRLAAAAAAGQLAEAWQVGVDPQELAGLGPFRLRSHLPGERLELERNPHYWRRDAVGNQLPYLDEIVVLFAPSPEAELLRFEAGDSDLIDGLAADAFERLQSRKSETSLLDLGPGLVYDFLFFNLNDLEPGALPDISRKQAWMRLPEFRRAISHAVDRQAIARLVYQGRATPVGGHITPANRRWHDPRIEAPELSDEKARQLLEGAGFSWRADGRLLDAEGVTVDLTLVTNSSNSRRVETATVVQEDLRRIGIDLHVVPLDFGALLDRVYETFDYEIGLLGLGRGGMDPNSSLNVWLSTGDSHLWRLSGGAISPWQLRLDQLLAEQMTELNPDRRHALVGEIQLLVAEQLPFVFLVAPNVLVGANPELGNFAPVPVDPGALWNAERLFWRPGA